MDLEIKGKENGKKQLISNTSKSQRKLLEKLIWYDTRIGILAIKLIGGDVIGTHKPILMFTWNTVSSWLC